MVNKKINTAVTKISVSSDNTRMTVGHVNGWVVLWDIDYLIEAKMLKIAEFQKLSILSIDFVGNENERVIASDMGGNVGLFIFKHGVFSYNCDKYGIWESKE